MTFSLSISCLIFSSILVFFVLVAYNRNVGLSETEYIVRFIQSGNVSCSHFFIFNNV